MYPVTVEEAPEKSPEVTSPSFLVRPSRPAALSGDTAQEKDWRVGRNELSLLREHITQSSSDTGEYASDKRSGKGFSLSEAVNLALHRSPVLKGARLDIEKAKEAIIESEAAYYPSVNMEMKSGIESKGRDNNVAGLTGEQMLYDFGKTRNSVNYAKAARSFSAGNYNKNYSDVVRQVITAYLETGRYYRLIEITETQLKGFSYINGIAEKRASQGAGSESDYSQTKLKLATSVSQLNDYKSQYSKWRAALDNLTGSEISGAIRHEVPAELINQCKRMDMDPHNSPSVLLAGYQINMAAFQEKIESAKNYPTVTLNPYYDYYLDTRGNSLDKHRTNHGVYVNVKVPLYQGGAIASREKQATHSLFAARAKLDAELHEATTKLAESISQTETSRNSLASKNIRKAEAVRARDLYLRQYLQLGTRSISDLLSVESEIHQTAIDIVNQEFQLAGFSVDCLYYSGELTFLWKWVTPPIG
ncbi:TolC family protein [Serratia marcescens]|uniref:TolC family protein n=1 Tax=Serratia marcescens TaxID=615 RepID=UPI001747A500